MAIKLCIVLYIAVMAVCITAAVNIYVKAKKTPVLYSLTACHILIFFWLFLAIMENMAGSAQEALLIDRVILFPISFLGGFWLIFALYYGGAITKKNRFLPTLILVPPTILYIPAFTRNYFYLIIEKKLIGEGGWTEWGIFFKITYCITILYLVLGIILIIAESLKTNKRLKIRKILIISAAIIPLAVNIIATSEMITTLFDYTPVSFSICFALISIAIFRFKLLDITPVAVNNIFGSMEDAILIINGENNIVDYNRSAVTEFIDILDIRDVKDIGNFVLSLKKHADESKPIERLSEMLENGRSGDAGDLYFTLLKMQGGNIRQTNYFLSLKPLEGDGGRRIGSIIYIKNVSAYKKVTLEKERCRLSGDLHDTLGNCIMAISANLKYAIEKFGPTEDVLLSIRQAHSAATGGILYLRRIVEELTPLDLEKYGLIPALQSMFKKLETTGVTIDFHYSGADAGAINGSRFSEMIYMICQEALNNSFYHGRANEVFINLVVSNDELKLYISDDGTGCANIVKGRGLAGIEERVAATGGKADFGSPSDGGFNIRITLPIEADMTVVKSLKRAGGRAG